MTAATICAIASVPVPAAASSLGRSPTLLVLPASGRGVSATIVAGARAWLVSSLGRPDRFPVIDFDRPPTAWPPSDAEASLLARQMGANLAVSLDISRTGAPAPATTLELTCTDASTGVRLRHMREMTTAGPEVLPSLMEWMASRLQRSFEGPGPAPAAAIAGAPPPPPARTRAVTFGASAQVLVPLSSPARQVSGLGGFGALIGIDGGYVLADVFADYAAGGGQHVAGAGLGFYLPLASDGTVPFIGGGAAWVGQQLGGQGASGVQLRPGIGLMWGRHDVIRMRVDVAYFIDLFQELEPDRLIPGAGAPHASHGLAFAVGAAF